MGHKVNGKGVAVGTSNQVLYSVLFLAKEKATGTLICILWASQLALDIFLHSMSQHSILETQA